MSETGLVRYIPLILYTTKSWKVLEMVDKLELVFRYCLGITGNAWHFWYCLGNSGITGNAGFLILPATCVLVSIIMHMKRKTYQGNAKIPSSVPPLILNLFCKKLSWQKYFLTDEIPAKSWVGRMQAFDLSVPISLNSLPNESGSSW